MLSGGLFGSASFIGGEKTTEEFSVIAGTVNIGSGFQALESSTLLQPSACSTDPLCHLVRGFPEIDCPHQLENAYKPVEWPQP